MNDEEVAEVIADELQKLLEGFDLQDQLAIMLGMLTGETPAEQLEFATKNVVSRHGAVQENCPLCGKMDMVTEDVKGGIRMCYTCYTRRRAVANS